jgi:hypothetical protein
LKSNAELTAVVPLPHALFATELGGKTQFGWVRATRAKFVESTCQANPRILTCSFWGFLGHRWSPMVATDPGAAELWDQQEALMGAIKGYHNGAEKTKGSSKVRGLQ